MTRHPVRNALSAALTVLLSAWARMGGQVLERKDWTLLAVAAAGGHPLTPVQLQKSLFLLSKREPGVDRRRFYSFRPYNYGPFSADVYKDAEILEAEGLLRIERGDVGRSWPTYSATSDGLSAASAIDAPPELRDYLARAVTWARSLTFQQLVSAIYGAFPEERRNSVFRD